ncbi:hypothetical protein QYM36_005374 [Artemia franciscana]|uniref:Uncharacterized protein n=1 Tax=Artemia franciscana TaxID=6661 RepID=A0AA88LC07_ARTSF|nr:hypothetical protein QYM36_005374 [Artemia franciscana]
MKKDEIRKPLMPVHRLREIGPRRELTGEFVSREIKLLLDMDKKYLQSFSSDSDRIARARLRHKKGKATVLICYASGAITGIRDIFYLALINVLSKVSHHDIVIMVDDLNFTVCNSHKLWRQVSGKVNLDPLNDSRLRLLQFCKICFLVMLNTLFVRGDIYKNPWYSNDDNKGMTCRDDDHALEIAGYTGYTKPIILVIIVIA